MNPLVLAIEEKYNDITKLLIRRGADINASENALFKNGWHEISNTIFMFHYLCMLHCTPLHATISAHSIDIAKMLVERGADINGKSKVKPYISYGIYYANVHKTPLIHAIEEHETEIAKMLINGGANIDVKEGALNNTTYENPLMHAVKNQEYDVAMLLIEKGSNCNIEDDALVLMINDV